MAWNWGIGIITFAFGLGVGFLIAYLIVPRSGRIQALEQELRAAQASDAEYRSKVNQHFQKTAELFEDMTGRYRAVYQHMASGAQLLCEERPPALQLDIIDRGQPAAEADSLAAIPIPATPHAGEPETEFDLQLSTAPHAALKRGEEDSDDYLGDSPHVPELTDEVVMPTNDPAKTGARRQD